MKRKITLWLAVTFMLHSVCSLAQIHQGNNPAFTGSNPSVNRSLPADSYVNGQIVLKVREGLGPYLLQEGKVSFNVSSLDEKVQLYEVNKLEKRFRHKPIPENSGLPDLSRIYRIGFPEEYSVQEVAEAFSKDPNIEYAEPVQMNTLAVVPDDPLYGQQQHLPQIKAEEAWEIHKGEDGDSVVVVAIIDTGTDWLHEDLTENTWQNLGEDADGDGETMSYISGQWQLDPDDLNQVDDDGNGYIDDLIGWDFYDWTVTGDGSNPDPQPGNPVGAHGTHCSGIAAGRTNNGVGIASISWNVKYLPVQSSNGQNNIQYGYDGMIYAAEQEADMISCSWGGLGNYSPSAAEAISYATGLGSIVLCAAGNDNQGGDFYPAGYPGVVSVASVNLGDTKADYSNFNPAVDVSAPGGGFEGGILSTVPDNEYEFYSGTSMATPMVAGLTALIKSYHPDWTNEQLLTQLFYTADNIDSLNPEYEHMLGYGRINAFRALSETGVTAPQELEFKATIVNIADEDNNSILEPGETVTVDFNIKNCNHFFGCDNVTFTLTTDDDEIEVTSDPYQVDVQPDGMIIMEDIFQFHISSGATPHIAKFTLTVGTDCPVVGGSGLEFELSIAPSGILVIDLFDKSRDMSGNYILNFLNKLGMEATYTHGLPQSLLGYETVFLSCGNLGPKQDQGFISAEDIEKIVYFIIAQGEKNIYIESGAFFLGMYYTGNPYYATMCNYFGVQSVQFPSNINQIGNLVGTAGTIMEGIHFEHSSQLFNVAIDAITPKTGAFIPFSEEGYGNVSVYNQATNRKTFYLGYTLAELDDMDSISSRYNVLMKVLDFFGYELPENYVSANFKAGNRFGKSPLEVQFTSISLCDPNSTFTSWQWDFNGDGVIDSYEENPSIVYDQAGNYDVMLVTTSSSGISDTLVQEDFVGVRQGMFVYEVAGGQRNFSGSYIRDILTDKYFFPVDYATVYPLSFIGYDAIFLSQGFYRWFHSNTPDGISEPLVNYLESGGRAYVEGGDVFGWDLAGLPVLLYFGLSNADDGSYDPLTQLQGQPGALTEGMMFDQSNQFVYPFIDKFVPWGNGIAAFVEDGVPIVAVQNQNDTYRTFCFSYALAELADNETTTREELLTAILEFFGFPYTGLTEQINTADLKVSISPNPFSDHTTISYELDCEAAVKIILYNSNGLLVKTLLSVKQAKGLHSMEFYAGGLPAGIYFFRLSTDDYRLTTTGKMVVVR